MLRKFRVNSLFIKLFLFLFAFILSIFLIFAYYTYKTSQSTLQKELLSYTEQQVSQLSHSVDGHIKNMRFMLATLSTNTSVKTFITAKNANQIINNCTQIIISEIKALQITEHSLDSIYIYSSESETILSSNHGEKERIHFEDWNWLDTLAPSDQPYYLSMRKKNNRYPYLLSIIKRIKSPSGYGYIVLNIDLSKYSLINSFKSSDTEHFFIITNDSEILFREEQKDILEPISTIPELNNFSNESIYKQIFIDQTTPYIYSQTHSDEYPWNYVLITYPSAYTSSLSTTRGLVLTFLFIGLLISFIIIFCFVLQSTKPLRFIRNFIENPQYSLEAGLNDKESREIIQKIMYYVHTSESLSQELNKQLQLLNDTKLFALQSQINPHFLFNTLNMIHMLETDTLGYDHIATKMTTNLGKILQYALDSTNFVPLSVEFYYANLFIKIMDERYEHTIRFETHLDQEIESIKVPKLIIQPLIENAVFHGLSRCNHHEKRLIISAYKEDNNCIISIKDNGVGMANDQLNSLLKRISDFELQPANSIGLHNVNLRMHLLHGDDFNLSISSKQDAGTEIKLRFKISP